MIYPPSSYDYCVCICYSKKNSCRYRHSRKQNNSVASERMSAQPRTAEYDDEQEQEEHDRDN